MNYHHAERVFVLGVCLWLALIPMSGLAAAQQSSTEPATQTAAVAETGLTSQTVQDQLKRVESDQQLEAATRAQAVGYYNKALDELKAAEQWTARANSYEQAVRQAPGRLQAAKEDLKRFSGVTSMPADVSDKAMAELQQELGAAESDLAKSQQRLEQLDKEPRQRTERRTQIRKRREEIDKELASVTGPQGPPVVANAQRTYEQARDMARQSELAAYSQELASYDAATELLSVQRDVAARQVAREEKLVKFWQDAINDRRQEETARLAREAERARRQAEADTEPAARDIAALAEKVAELARKREDILKREKDVTDERASTKALLDRVTSSSEEVRARVEAAGVTRAMGMMLRKEQADLPRLSDLRSRLEQLQETSNDLQVEMIGLRKERASLPDIQTLIDEDVSRIDPAWIEKREQVRNELTSLGQKQREGLASLLSECSVYQDALIKLQEVTESLIDETESYEEFIDEHILWLRSNEELGPRSVLDALSAAEWVLREAKWSDVPRTLASDARTNPATMILSGLAVLLVIGCRGKYRARLEQAGDRARQKLNLSFAPTAMAVFHTALLGVSWPLLFWVLSWWLSTPTGSSDTTKAVAFSLGRVGTMFLIYGSIRELLRPKGLAEAHLGWPPPVLRMVRKHLLWLMAVTLPLAFVIAFVTQWQATVDWKDSISRLAFLAAMAAFSVFAAIIFKPSTGIFAGRIARNPKGALARYRLVWYTALVGIPVAMGVLTIVGYYYTSLQLMARIYRTAWFVLFVLVLRGLILRWIFLVHRKLAIAQARKRLADKQAELAREGEAEAEETIVPPPEEPELDIAALSGQARQMFNAAMVLTFVLGMWYIWVDILPALGFLKSIALYPHAKTTLADVALAVITLVMTGIASKNLSAFLEITILPRLQIRAGERYAILAVSRYVITAAGIALACGFLGIGWSSVQWLVAAITVGLGFGLQEIFANFVSGLILLFERPIRVGDTVTVGETSGIITRIQIRATTLMSWDRKELIIPNKEFVTGQVVNWTLSDSVLRVVVPVGVAYGSDTAQVEQILRRVVREHALVLHEPPPQVFFTGFGASSLDFETRVFISGVDNLFSVRHDLLNAIDREFRKAGIEIAFPQQDIHIRSVEDAFPIVDQREASKRQGA